MCTARGADACMTRDERRVKLKNEGARVKPYGIVFIYTVPSTGQCDDPVSLYGHVCAVLQCSTTYLCTVHRRTVHHNEKS